MFCKRLAFGERRVVTAMLIGVLALPALATARAGTKTSGPINATANVPANCTVSATALSFGSYDPLGANASTDLPGSSNVTYACTKGSKQAINVSVASTGNIPGASPYGSSAYQFAMSDGAGDDLWYDLSFSGGSLATTHEALPPSTSFAPVTIPLYGHVHSGQDVPDSTTAHPSYLDNVVVTITFGP